MSDPESPPPEDTPPEDTPPEDTPQVSARDALGYATHDEMLKLYGLLVAGWVGILLGQFGFVAISPLLSLVGIVAFLVGLLASLASAVAILHKVVTES